MMLVHLIAPAHASLHAGRCKQGVFALSSMELKITYVSPTDLKPHPKNPRHHTRQKIQKLKRSVSAFAFNAPILADSDGTILAGHARWAAAKLAGHTQIPAIYLSHLDKKQATAFMLADNKLAEMASWNKPVLADVLKELAAETLEFELEDTGFQTAEIDLLMNAHIEPDMNDSTDEAEISSSSAVSQPGDTWKLGDHFLICGSALDANSYYPFPAGYQASAIFTDPPWNLPISGFVSGNGKLQHREFVQGSGEMTRDQFYDFLNQAIERFTFYAKNGALVFLCVDWRHFREFCGAAEACGLQLLNVCVWVKNNGGMGSLYRSRHELILVLRKGDAPHQNNVQLGRHGRNRTNVWNYAAANIPAQGKRALEYHPTPKPLALVADAILDCTRSGDFVLDPFLGSGTTLLAAERTGRKCYGIEIDPIYVDTTIQRWEKMTRRKAKHIKTGETFAEIAAQRMPNVQ